ncbi:MAG: vitamin K epoxide reductase family protein [Pseudolysinimonas sp.]
MGFTGPTRSPLGVPITFVVTGLLGLLASLSLTLDKLALLENPSAELNCNVSVLVGCTSNLNSEQGSVFGFPNPILGLVFWSAIIAIGVGILAGARFAGWFWILASLATASALTLVVWFIAQSIFVLGVLCPWCMLTWAVIIPMFFVIVLQTLQSEWFPPRLRSVAGAGYAWVPLATLVCYLVIALLAQLRLDAFGQLF